MASNQSWWISEKVTSIWESLPDGVREYTERVWKETWRLKDEQLINRESSCNILFGKKDGNYKINLSDVRSYKGSVGFLFERQRPTQFLTPAGNFSASIPLRISGLRASVSYTHPRVDSNEEYDALYHWLYKFRLSLPHNEKSTVSFGVTPMLQSFSFPLELTLGNGNAITNYSIGLTRDHPVLSFAYNLNCSITEKKATASSEAEKEVVTSTTASCNAQIHGLLASADWNREDLNCSFKQEDMGFSVTSACQINVKDATKNVCSVGVGKTWNGKDKLLMGIEVVFDTHDVATITYSQSMAKKFSLNLSAKVDGRDINKSHLPATFSFT